MACPHRMLPPTILFTPPPLIVSALHLPPAFAACSRRWEISLPRATSPCSATRREHSHPAVSPSPITDHRSPIADRRSPITNQSHPQSHPSPSISPLAHTHPTPPHFPHVSQAASSERQTLHIAVKPHRRMSSEVSTSERQNLLITPKPSSAGEHSASVTSETLQCKATVASCVHNGKEMLEAMVREQQSGTLHHSAACRLVADTFLAVVADLGQAAESDEMKVTRHTPPCTPPAGCPPHAA